MSRIKSFLAAVALVAAGVVPAAAYPFPTTCTTAQVPAGAGQNNNWTVTVTAGPCPVDCVAATSSLDCNSYGACTGIEYSIVQNYTRSADRVSTLVPADLTVFYPTIGLYAACAGDPDTLQGKNSCQDKAVRLSSTVSTTVVRLVVDGKKDPVLSSIAIRNNGRVEACAIVGLGQAPLFDTTACVPNCGGLHIKQRRIRSETIQFGECAVEFTFDLDTGALIDAELTDDSPVGEDGCDFLERDVADAELRINNGEGYTTLGLGQFADGYLATGLGSCQTRMIGGRLISWGRPCP